MSWLSYCKSFIPRLKQQHLQYLGKECCINNPIRFTDKLEWLKIYDSTYLKTLCADKVTARKYVAHKIGKDISVPLLGVYDSFGSINFNNLPSNYIMKTNHASHTNLIVTNGQLDKNKANQFYTTQLKRDYSTFAFEMFYKLIPPKIVIEPLMSDGETELTDYKFYCFNGIAKFCQVIADRSSNETITHFLPNWEYESKFDRIEHPSNPNIQRPNTYNEMCNYAEILSKDFKFVRVDFYEINGHCYFGELTFIPAAAYIKFKDDSADYILGHMLSL